MAVPLGQPAFLLPPTLAGAALQPAPLQPALLGYPGGPPLQPLDPQHARLLPPAAVQALQLGLPLPGSAAAAGLPPLPPQPPEQQQQQQHAHLQYTLDALAPHHTAAVVKAAQAAAAALASGGGGDLLYVNPRQLAAIQRRREKRGRQEQRMLQLVAKAVSAGLRLRARAGWRLVWLALVPLLRAVAFAACCHPCLCHTPGLAQQLHTELAHFPHMCPPHAPFNSAAWCAADEAGGGAPHGCAAHPQPPGPLCEVRTELCVCDSCWAGKLKELCSCTPVQRSFPCLCSR